MPQISHEFAIGRVRALEGTLLKQDVIEKLLTAQDAQEAFRMLAEAGWGEISSRAELEQAAENRQKEACAFLKECSADPVLTDLFLLQYDMLNLKVLLKAQMLGKPAQRLSSNGPTDPEKLRAAIENHDMSLLPAEYAQTVQAVREKCADWRVSRLGRLSAGSALFSPDCGTAGKEPPLPPGAAGIFRLSGGFHQCPHGSADAEIGAGGRIPSRGGARR